MADILSLYQQLPYPLKVIAASARGYQLRQWRYGRDTERLVGEALERECWTVENWHRWQEVRLAEVLHRAATKVPWYRDHWQKKRQYGDRASWDALENWPLLEKDTVRNNPKAFIADDQMISKMIVDHTGGTTGKPTLVYESRETVRQWYALTEARTRVWNKVSYRDRWGMFGGQKVIPLDRTKPPFWVMNYGLNQMYFSVFHINNETAHNYVEALNRFRPSNLLVYPSVLAVLAQHVLKQGLRVPEIKVIFCNAEKVHENHKRLIEEVFKCPVFETYGNAELTAAGSECSERTMHYWPETGIIECYNEQESRFITNGAEQGGLVMTGLLNSDMPLIRYCNGDQGMLPDWEFQCACGKKLPKIGRIQGRAKDLIKTSDGRQLYILDSVFNGLPVIEAQLIQKSLSHFIFRYVPNRSSDNLDEKINNVMKPYLGNVIIELIPVEYIPREENGKFKPFISNLIDTLDD